GLDSAEEDPAERAPMGFVPIGLEALKLVELGHVPRGRTSVRFVAVMIVELWIGAAVGARGLSFDRRQNILSSPPHSQTHRLGTP
ncbi:MAG: hypothetical protein FWD55_09070, partial [Propionibacteriaceae bacterium]|nr:hypothetical protein [Propionibacteriaceae bacterium]